MENYKINPTYRTPEISFNSKTGKLLMSGKFMSTDGVNFYKPAIHWLEEYSKLHAEQTTLKLTVDAINSGSAKALLHIMKILARNKDASQNVKVVWYYDEDDPDMFEMGQDYEALLDLKFEYFKID